MDHATETDHGSSLADISTPQELTVVSNREPYEHSYVDGEISLVKPVGGLATALDGVLQEAGGTWLAWGSGTADFDPEVVTNGNEYRPKGNREYVLRRLELSANAVENYYYGYSNQVLWPLCHLETEHVVHDEAFWDAYKQVNDTFADALEVDADGLIWLQDYHLALVPRAVRKTSGDAATLVHFWHIPWPPIEVFETCPHRRQLLDGLLANDAIGFHIERYRKRFVECVEALVPSASVDDDRETVEYLGHMTETYVSPVGINTEWPTATHDQWRDKQREYGIDRSKTLIVGVDRLDYTKGILEKLDAIEAVLASNPALRGEFTVVQKVSKSREQIPSYRRYHERVLNRIQAVNEAFRIDDWEPIRYIDEQFDQQTLRAFLADADIGVVSSRRDGLNLVAEELIYATRDDPAVLLLSEFTGAATLLDDGAVSINPFDTQQFAAAIRQALEMSTKERTRRHAQMTAAVEQHSLHSWLATHGRLFEQLL